MSLERRESFGRRTTHFLLKKGPEMGACAGIGTFFLVDQTAGTAVMISSLAAGLVAEGRITAVAKKLKEKVKKEK